MKSVVSTCYFGIGKKNNWLIKCLESLILVAYERLNLKEKNELFIEDIRNIFTKNELNS